MIGARPGLRDGWEPGIRLAARLERPAGAVQAGIVIALAGLARLLYGPGAIGYDASYAALWGSQAASGVLPHYEAPFAPTPHPLANLVAMPLSFLGDASFPAHVHLTLVAFGALGWFAFLLGARLFSPSVGAAFAVIVFTRPALVNETLGGLVDIPFVALVLAAAAVEAREGQRPRLVLVLLALAGLLRPEAWPLAALYVVWRWRRDPAGRPLAVALAAVGPVLWALSDLAVTGDPLYSLHGTRELADLLDRPRGLVSALEAAPGYMRNFVEPEVAFAGMAGVLAGMAWLYRGSVAPATVGGLGLLGFLVIGIAGLPVLGRYLLVPSMVVALFCAVACLGWTVLERRHPVRRPWMVIGSVVGAAVAFSLVEAGREIDAKVTFNEARRSVQADLKALTEAAPVRRALERCSGLSVPEYQPVPLLAYWLDQSPKRFKGDPAGEATDRLFVGYASPEVARVLSITPRSPLPTRDAPPGSRTAFANSSWVARSFC
jgi:hypothetical protein